ncbi:hypothetical protein OKW21_002985 [Catalinimonas alkaloidigena]|uniref:hypothetical protein n=1 Tax=Catalinimonas alkaloidigena TaxID=1075417 RepID=UPI002406D60D|nr:hypothetical protein [Catalinimonas alkaloidigena]MDF9797722.1 hypothetical protein [Catalinimonas alkaloidigena]
MKKLSVLAFALLFSHMMLAQSGSESLERHLTSVDIGFLGAWINHERQLGEQLIINANLGFEGVLYGGGGEFNYLFVPAISVEPRFYYNFNRRVSKGKRTINNSAEYLTISTTFYPDLFDISNENEPRSVSLNEGVSFIPKWGTRRALGEHFKFDFSVGYGISVYEGDIDGRLGLDLSVGYIFGK